MSRKQKLTYGAVVVIVLIVVVIVLRGGDESPFDTVIAERGDLMQEVNVTGRVIAAQSADLAFEKTGRVESVYVEVGDSVLREQKLVSLQNADILAQIAQSEASLKKEQANLDKLRRGSRSEEIEIQRVRVSNAEIALADSKKNLVDVIQDAFTKSDDAVRGKTSKFFSQTFPTVYKIDFEVSDTQLESTIEQGRSDLEATLGRWQASLTDLSVLSDLDSFTKEAELNIGEVKTFLNNTALGVNDLTANATLTQATVDGYKSDVSTARTNVNTAISNLSTADEELKDAESALKLEKQELILAEAGATTEELLAQEAKVEEAAANVRKFNADLGDTILRAPFSGLITLQEAKVGEIAPANEVLVSLISPNQFEIETNVPEADVAKISIGDSSSVTLDAYGSGDLFLADVVLINPAETIIEGVATYKTTLQFLTPDERIKSGMTANIDILTAERTNVITIPSRAVVTRGNEKIVRLLNAGIVAEVVVKTGVRGSNGSIEIISGVKEGDEVIVFIPK